MGKASSAKKVARAARTGGGRTRRGQTSWVWPTLMALVVILGTAGIVYSRDQRQPDNTRPLAASAGRAGDHWHAAIGFFICGQFTANLPEGTDTLGIHSHGDNVVHIHPFGSSASGKRAKLSIWFDSTGADVSATSIKLPTGEKKSNGDKCGDTAGRVETKVWDSRDPADEGHIVSGDPSNIRPRDGQLITVAFVPPGTDIPRPPSADTLDKLSDVGPAAGETSTTVPGADSSSTSSTAPSTSSTTPGSVPPSSVQPDSNASSTSSSRP